MKSLSPCQISCNFYLSQMQKCKIFNHRIWRTPPHPLTLLLPVHVSCRDCVFVVYQANILVPMFCPALIVSIKYSLSQIWKWRNDSYPWVCKINSLKKVCKKYWILHTMCMSPDRTSNNCCGLSAVLTGISFQ